MSKHDLKGMDLGKVGANKDVDFTFKEYMDSFGGGSKKIPKITDLQQLEDYYGPNELIPGLGKTTGQLKVELQPVGLPKGTRVLGDGTIVPEDAPRNLSRVVAGFLDTVLRDTTDFDKRGILGEGLGKIDLDDLSQYKLLPSQQNKLKTALKERGELDPDPTSTMEEGAKSFLDFKKKSDTQSRKGRILDSAMEFLNYTLTSPKILSDLRRESDYVQNRLLQAELRKQSFPNAVQSRMLAGSTGFATEAEAIAKQQQAATELAKAGIRTPTATFSA